MDKTREEKTELIRAMVNNDEYISMLHDEELDELLDAIKEPVASRFHIIYETIERIYKTVYKLINRE